MVSSRAGSSFSIRNGVPPGAWALRKATRTMRSVSVISSRIIGWLRDLVAIGLRANLTPLAVGLLLIDPPLGGEAHRSAPDTHSRQCQRAIPVEIDIAQREDFLSILRFGFCERF